MGYPEETLAAAAQVDTAAVAAEPVATITTAETDVTAEEPGTEDLTGALVGWKRKVSGAVKDATFVAPDGEEINTKRQLDKYLKAHPGTLTASDFDWNGPADEAEETLPEKFKRSAVPNSTEAGDEETDPKQPVVKRSRKSHENGKDETDGKAENGEGNGETKIMDVDASELEVPAAEETKEMTAEADIPPAQGIHALVGDAPKPHGVEVAQEPEALL